MEGQIHGGIAQGIGGTFLEELPYDENGQLLAATLHGLSAAHVHGVPDVEIHHIETPSPINVGGFKGMGEGGCINVAPALANAIIDAVKPLAESASTRRRSGPRWSSRSWRGTAESPRAGIRNTILVVLPRRPTAGRGSPGGFRNRTSGKECEA